MKHFTTSKFWNYYYQLPKEIQKLADKNYELLKRNPQHPSLHFKKVGSELWSVRIGKNYRALGVNEPGVMLWFWIGKHSEYDNIIAHR